jgi:polysaccharide export outer membrane protein
VAFLFLNHNREASVSYGTGQRCVDGWKRVGLCLLGLQLLAAGAVGQSPWPPQPQGLTPIAPQPTIRGVDSAFQPVGQGQWQQASPLDFQPLLHGEYLGPIRLPALLDYRLRVGDEVRFVYLLTRESSAEAYRLMPGDELMIRSNSVEELGQGSLEGGVRIMDDGNLWLQNLDQPIRAAGMTIDQLRRAIEQAYIEFYNDPAISVAPVKTNSRLRDLLEAVDNRFGNGGYSFTARVNPDGRIQLPGIGAMQVLGLSLEEIKREINLRYAQRYVGIHLEPTLGDLATSFVYVYGEVGNPGRFELQGPTSVTQALAMAGGAQFGGNQRQVVIFRRAEDWRLVATMLDLRASNFGRQPTPADEIWVRDSDLIIVPPTPVRVFDEVARQVFTDGVYRIFPFGGVSFTNEIRR